MAIQTVLAACLLAVATASPQYGGYAPAPKSAPAYYAEPEPYDAHPKYAFEYSVHDDSTYDIKSQKEERDGDVVKGVYELYEPDGSKRIVVYSDEGHGFEATVHKEPPKGGYKYAPAPKYAPTPKYESALKYAPAPKYESAPKYAKPSYSSSNYYSKY